MNNARKNPFGNNRVAQNRSSVIIQFDRIPVPDPSFGGVGRMNPCGPPCIPVLDDTVGGNMIQPFRMLVIMGVKGEPRVGSDQLQALFVLFSIVLFSRVLLSLSIFIPIELLSKVLLKSTELSASVVTPTTLSLKVLKLTLFFSASPPTKERLCAKKFSGIFPHFSGSSPGIFSRFLPYI